MGYIVTNNHNDEDFSQTHCVARYYEVLSSAQMQIIERF